MVEIISEDTLAVAKTFRDTEGAILLPIHLNDALLRRSARFIDTLRKHGYELTEIKDNT